MPAIEVEHLVKRFGDATAVDDISFSVEFGEFFGFLGPNGAGKTTTISMLCTLLRPSGGTARVNGYDVAAQQSQVRRSIGLVFQEPSLDDRLTAAENLEFHARIYNVPDREWRNRSQDLLHVVELWDRRNDLVRTFSGGMRRRLELARGLLHRPVVLFLDEPTLGLDPQTREHIWHYLLDLRAREHVTLFLTTHYMEETEGCDRIAIIDRGHIVALDAPEHLRRLAGGDIVTLETPDPAAATTALQARFGLQVIGAQRGALRVEVTDGDRLIPRLITELGVPITAISLRRPTLEDVFIQLTGSQIHDGGAAPVMGHGGHGRH